MKYFSIYDHRLEQSLWDDVYSNVDVMVRVLLPSGKILYFEFPKSFIRTNLDSQHEQDSKVVEK